MILQDADSKPNSDWFGKFWWPLSMSWKFQTKFSLVWKNHWLLPTPWTLNQFQFYLVKYHFWKGKTLKHAYLHAYCFTCQYCHGSEAVNMDSEVLLNWFWFGICRTLNLNWVWNLWFAKSIFFRSKPNWNLFGKSYTF